MKLSQQKIDTAKQEAGDWVDRIPEMDGLRLKVRGVNNRDWRKMQTRLINAVPRNRRMNGLDPDDSDRINGVLLRDTVLLDWDGLDGDDDQPIPYSKQKAGELLLDPQYAKFRDAVMWAGTMVAEQREAEIEDDAKN
jgi:hypothetical protein